MSKRSSRFASNILWALAVTGQVVTGTAQAAPCCGGSFASPSIITGDNKAQVTTSYSTLGVLADVYADGTWRRREFEESSETLRFDAAHIFSDRWQFGASLPLVQRSREGGDSASGIADVSMTLAYEFLPEWEYHPIRPKGLTFIQLITPTGRPIQEAVSPYQLDGRGRGFWALGVGTLLTKQFQRWDTLLSADVHQSLPRSYTSDSTSGHLRPGLGGSVLLGLGWSYLSYRIGTLLQWLYEDPIRVTGSVTSTGAVERFTTASLNLSYLYQDDWALTFSYSDQTLFGQPINTRLGTVTALQLQRRWTR